MENFRIPGEKSQHSMSAFKCDPVKTYLFDIGKYTFEKVIRHLNISQLFDNTKQSERNKKKSKRKT